LYEESLVGGKKLRGDRVRPYWLDEAGGQSPNGLPVEELSWVREVLSKVVRKARRNHE